MLMLSNMIKLMRLASGFYCSYGQRGGPCGWRVVVSGAAVVDCFYLGCGVNAKREVCGAGQKPSIVEENAW